MELSTLVAKSEEMTLKPSYAEPIWAATAEMAKFKRIAAATPICTTEP